MTIHISDFWAGYFCGLVVSAIVGAILRNIGE